MSLSFHVMSLGAYAAMRMDRGHRHTDRSPSIWLRHSFRADNCGRICDQSSMTFTLYNAPQSTCSQRVRFVLNAKQLPFDEVKLDLLAGDQLKPDYLALNPNGGVPRRDHD